MTQWHVLGDDAPTGPHTTEFALAALSANVNAIAIWGIA